AMPAAMRLATPTLLAWDAGAVPARPATPAPPLPTPETPGDLLPPGPTVAAKPAEKPGLPALPETAGLLVNGLALALPGVAPAVRGLNDIDAVPRGPAVFRWLGLLAWSLGGGAVAYLFARRRQRPK